VFKRVSQQRSEDDALRAVAVSERRSWTHPMLLQKIYEGAHLRQEQAVAQG
jgi:hypothetical protein